jgi:hypothetical protein
MKKLFSVIITLGFILFVQAQQTDLFNEGEVGRIERILSADDMQGRASFTPGIEKAADFIGKEFKSAGLQPWNNSSDYRQSFSMIQSSMTNASAELDHQQIDSKNIIVFSSQPDISVNQGSGYEKSFIKSGDNFRAEAFKYIQSNKNCLVFVDTSFSKNFPRLSSFSRQQFKSDRSIVFVLSYLNPEQYTIHFQQDIKEKKLANIVGILPGKSRKDEYVIFSAHYDHLGIGKPNAEGDSIYNGANDDASGVTAVIMLAKYFSKLKNNERTIVFATFAAEEIGGYGSQYFSKQFDPAKVMAMFNIEMIGTESKWGTNSAYITGYEKSDMPKILEKNLENSPFKFYPDPYPQQQLFYRSDNATLARQGVPAHSISTSKMDSEKYYHTQDDEIETLDMKNMSAIIQAIALSSRSIIEGKDTPSRVDTSQLR